MRTRLILLASLLFFGLSVAANLAGGGANFDYLNDADRKAMEERFAKEIWPLMERGGKQGCVGCHNGKIVSSLKMSGKADKDFRMMLKEGFFIPGDSGSALSRIKSKDRKQRMPPPGKGDPWTQEEMDVLNKFVMDVEAKQQKKRK